MSYPYRVQPLVIEDEPTVKELYEELLGRFGTAPPKFAFCYNDAIEHLKSSAIFHLVLLDLRLPVSAGLPAPESIDLGLSLLGECARREWYPVPALLIVSGHVGKASQSDLSESLHGSFHYGHVIVKGPDPELLTAEIGKAIDSIKRYTSIGVHVRDAGRAVFPVIGPREDDLLRRSVLEYPRGVGLDIEWWSANRYSVPQEPEGEWTKVLMGRFVLDDGDRPSRPHFFKLYPSSMRSGTVAAAQGLGSKLQHVSVVADVAGPTRALVVTQAVGPGDRRPMPLGQWLSRSGESVDAVRSVAAQIVQQVDQLGSSSPNMQPLSKFLWVDHDDGRLTQEWVKHGDSHFDRNLGPDPITVFRKLRAETTSWRYSEQSFVHGDLHVENVAVDVGDAVDQVRAFIFDAGATSRAPRLKDFAMLEVSVLLHSDGGLKPQMLDSLYEPNQSETTDASAPLTFLQALRIKCMPANDPQWPLYALLVFDQALVQLGGLAFGVSRNKVRNPRDAALLAARTGHWVCRLLADRGDSTRQ